MYGRPSLEDPKSVHTGEEISCSITAIKLKGVLRYGDNQTAAGDGCPAFLGSFVFTINHCHTSHS